ncbi:hypothetical protein [Streptomyces sp. ML-6]|uniref:hypothetical protein n=1 Tax=Streptomyces sp. ML-6 TaxID=2982693 RepID=UPI0024C0BCE1|nr:hypothetical protein [Streptomyces sp. ML-6]MDK0524750.1 hypothetical protein [Streptomyces sp. ML-6]
MPCPLEEYFEFDVDGCATMLLPPFSGIHPTAGVAEDEPLTIGYPVHRPLEGLPPRVVCHGGLECPE